MVQAHFDGIWRLLRRLGLSHADADDAAQHVFMTAARKMDSIGAGKTRSFLYGAALRVAANVRRGAKRRPDAPSGDIDDHLAQGIGPEESTELRAAWSLLDELLEHLPDELRRVLVLVELEQMEAAEVAELESIPVGTVASRLRRARERFRELLAEAEHRNPFKVPT